MQPCRYLLGKGWPLSSLACDVFLCFVTFPYGVLGQMLYLIVSIQDLCLLPYIDLQVQRSRLTTLIVLLICNSLSVSLNNAKSNLLILHIIYGPLPSLARQTLSCIQQRDFFFYISNKYHLNDRYFFQV